MTKTEFTSRLAERNGFSRTDAERILNAFLDSVEDALFKDGRLSLKGFGVFAVRERKERQVVNPLTGKQLIIPAGKTVGFRPGQALKNLLN